MFGKITELQYLTLIVKSFHRILLVWHWEVFDKFWSYKKCIEVLKILWTRFFLFWYIWNKALGKQLTIEKKLWVYKFDKFYLKLLDNFISRLYHTVFFYHFIFYHFCLSFQPFLLLLLLLYILVSSKKVWFLLINGYALFSHPISIKKNIIC